LIIAAAVSLALGIKTEVQSVFIIAKKFKMNLPGLIWFEQFLSYGELFNRIKTVRCISSKKRTHVNYECSYNALKSYFFTIY